jgi:hypothetical protein
MASATLDDELGSQIDRHCDIDAALTCQVLSVRCAICPSFSLHSSCVLSVAPRSTTLLFDSIQAVVVSTAVVVAVAVAVACRWFISRCRCRCCPSCAGCADWCCPRSVQSTAGLVSQQCPLGSNHACSKQCVGSDTQVVIAMACSGGWQRATSNAGRCQHLLVYHNPNAADIVTHNQQRDKHKHSSASSLASQHRLYYCWHY